MERFVEDIYTYNNNDIIEKRIQTSDPVPFKYCFQHSVCWQFKVVFTISVLFYFIRLLLSPLTFTFVDSIISWYIRLNKFWLNWLSEVLFGYKYKNFAIKVFNQHSYVKAERKNPIIFRVAYLTKSQCFISYIFFCSNGPTAYCGLFGLFLFSHLKLSSNTLDIFQYRLHNTQRPIKAFFVWKKKTYLALNVHVGILMALISDYLLQFHVN